MLTFFQIPFLFPLGLQRLVLQPMHPCLEHLRELRVCLREDGWRIVQVRTSYMASADKRGLFFVRSHFLFSSIIYVRPKGGIILRVMR